MTHLKLAATLLLLEAAAAPSLARAGEAAPAQPPVRVRVARLDGAAGGRSVAASVSAARRATLSTRFAANVKAVHAEEGQRVAAGQLLVSLADPELRGGLAAAQSALAAAASHERRIRELVAQRAATASELEGATAQRAQAEAAVAGAKANLAYTEIRAPYAATVLSRRVNAGDMVGPGQPLVELEGDGLELVASLSEAEARGLLVGKTVSFEANGAARGTARITALAAGGDPVSHRRGLRARVETSKGELRSGAFARILLPGRAAAPAAGAAEAGGLFVPSSALVRRGDLTGVFVAEGGKAQLRWISAGEAAGDHVAVRAGLRPGEAVIDAPGALRDGQAVEVQP
jgi:RND family efflux transporter MFP subunit